jgi:hypothetical protein
MFTAEEMARLLFLLGIVFFYATVFAVTRSQRTFWMATAIGALLLFGLLVAAHR